jgi:hypothetical protein
MDWNYPARQRGFEVEVARRFASVLTETRKQKKKELFAASLLPS